MKKKEVRPQADNRAEVFCAIAIHLIEQQPLRQQRLRSSIEMLQHKQTRFGQVSSGFDFYNQGLGVYISELLKEDSRAPMTLKSCVITGIHSAVLERFLYEKENSDYKAPNPFVTELITLHGIAAEAGYGEFCDWLGDYVYLLLSSEASESLQAIDPDFVVFFRSLLQARKTGKFDVALQNCKGMYEELITSVNVPEMLEEVLPRYCDYRWSNAFGWNNVNEKKKRAVNKLFPSSIFSDISWSTLVPFELFSLKYIYNRIYKSSLSLNTDHPLLSKSFTSIELPPDEVKNEIVNSLGYTIDSSIWLGWRSMLSASIDSM